MRAAGIIYIIPNRAARLESRFWNIWLKYVGKTSSHTLISEEILLMIRAVCVLSKKTIFEKMSLSLILWNNE